MMWDQIDCPQFVDFINTKDNSLGDSYFDVPHHSAESPHSSKGSKKARKSSQAYHEIQESPPHHQDSEDVAPKDQSTSTLYGTPKNTTIGSIDSHFSPRHNSSPISNLHLLRPIQNEAFEKPLSPKPRYLGLLQRLTKNTKAREAQPPKPIKEFWETLRQHTPGRLFKPIEKLTKPVPFRLTENKRKRENEENYQPLAEQVLNFERGIKKAKLNDGTMAFRIPTKPIVPKTPRLLTKIRSRQRKVPEEEPVTQYQFKAQPVDPRVYLKYVGLPGVGQIRPRPITKPVTPNMITRARCLQRRYTVAGSKLAAPFQFRAQPVAPGVLGNQSTVVQSRYLRFDKKSAPAASTEEPVPEIHFKATPMPNFTKVNLPQKPPLELTLTQPEPFTFDEADRQRWAKRNARLAELAEEKTKVPHFTAKPIPDYSRTGLPKKPEITLTSPHPFSFQTNTRVKPKQVEEEEEPQYRFFPPPSLGDLHTEKRALHQLEKRGPAMGKQGPRTRAGQGERAPGVEGTG